MNKHLQPRLAQIGRIRIGDAKGSGADKRRKLQHFRLTVPYASRPILHFASQLYGGTVAEWQNPELGKEFELYTTVNSLPVYVVADQCVLTGCERWAKGVLMRRCDGETILKDADLGLIGTPCQCPEEHTERQRLAQEGRACHDTTRIFVMLRDVPAIGLWRLDTHGYYPATQVMGQVQLLQQLGIHAPVEGMLMLGEGKRKVIDHEKGKVVGKRFPQVQLLLNLTPKQLISELPVSCAPRQIGPPPALEELWPEAPTLAQDNREEAPLSTPGSSPAASEWQGLPDEGWRTRLSTVLAGLPREDMWVDAAYKKLNNPLTPPGEGIYVLEQAETMAAQQLHEQEA